MSKPEFSDFSKFALILAFVSVLTGVIALRSELEWQRKIAIFALAFALLLGIVLFESWHRHMMEKDKIEGLFKK